MFRFACAIILLLTVLISGCGGGGGNGSPGPDPTGVSISISPHGAQVKTNEKCSFTATVSGATNPAVTWSVVEEIDGGIVSTNGLYTAPSTDGLQRHVRATSVEDPSKYAEAMVQISGEGIDPVGNNGVQISVSPNQVYLPPHTTMQFSATLVGHSDTSVTWETVEDDAGSINQDGLYTSPNVEGAFHVRVTSVADPSKSATATIVVIPSLPPFPFPD